jgi:hypothetical protein
MIGGVHHPQRPKSEAKAMNYGLGFIFGVWRVLVVLVMKLRGYKEKGVRGVTPIWGDRASSITSITSTSSGGPSRIPSRRYRHEVRRVHRR